MKTKVVKALLFYDDNLLILERSGKLFHGMEDLPGGKLEPGELPIPGLIREIKEETQLDVSQLLHVATHEWEDPDCTQYLEYLYCSLVNIRDVTLNPEEHSTFRWIELEHIESSKIHPKIKELILANLGKIKTLIEKTQVKFHMTKQKCDVH